MTDRQQSADLFQPLTGQEQVTRLEDKYCYSLDWEDDQESARVYKHGKVSEWRPNDCSPSTWLNSGTSGISIRNVRCPNMKRSGHKRKAEPVPKMSGAHKSATKEKTYSTTVTNFEELQAQTTGRDVNQKTCEHIPVDWCDISLADTERPKLATAPVSAKVDFQLSAECVLPVVVVPAAINQYLRDYQRDGIRFLYKHYLARTGAILGDDMGLGKTIQVIGFLSALLGKKGTYLDGMPRFLRQISDEATSEFPTKSVARNPFLIIGPSAVMYNWLDELSTWGYFTCSKFHGLDKESCLDSLRRGRLEVVVTTFETFRDNTVALNRIQWEAVIVDEVHKIKGLKAQLSCALRTINTPCRFGLTGTALQNDLTEVWSLLDWAQPGVLGSCEDFETEFVHAIELGQQQDATKRELALARKQKDKFSEIRRKMLLRRTKALIADQLPLKEDLVVMCRLTELQISIYKAILAHPDVQLILRSEDPCDCRSGKVRAGCCYKYASDGRKAWTLVFSFMHLILKAANHLALLVPDHTMEAKQAELCRSVCEVAFQNHPQFLKQPRLALFRTLSDPQYCGKMKVLQGLLAAFHTNHDKVLLFSYSTKLLDIIEQYIITQGYEYCRIDGKVNSQSRRDIVHRFNKLSSIFVCLISTKSGGLGLNLVGANKVVIFDPNWNPSHDLQAQDRAYRIGQTRDVKVYRLISVGTIEENIYLRQIYKQQLDQVAIGTANARRYFQGIQGDKENPGELFGVKNMFYLRTGDSCVTMDILKRNERLEQGLAGYDITNYIPPAQVTSEDCPEDSDTDDGCQPANSSQDSDEEDGFWKDLFGLDRASVHTSAPQDNQPLDVSHQAPDVLKKECNESDDEFSLIPRLHNIKQPFTGLCEKGETSDKWTSLSHIFSLDQSQLRRKNDNSTLVGHDISPGDISFSSLSDKKANKSHQLMKDNSPVRKRGAESGISWLFSDDSNSNDQVKEGNSNSIAKLCKPARPSSSGSPAELFGDLINEKFSDFTAVKPAKGKSFSSVSAMSSEATTSARSRRDKNEPIRKRIPQKGKSTRQKEDVSLEESVLRSEAVLHVHANKEVIGASRAEDHMTRCAMHDVFDLHANTQALAIDCQPYSDEETATVKSTRGRKKPIEDHNSKKCLISGPYKILIGQTPAAIKRQHWNEMCKHYGIDQLTHSRNILSADVATRLQMLKGFYCNKHPDLADVLTETISLNPVDQSSLKKNSTSKTESGKKTVDKPKSYR